MIFLSGHRASGKSTTADILKDKGLWILDVGPFWRSTRDKTDPAIKSTKVFREKLRETHNNPYYDQDYLSDYIINQYSNHLDKKDIVICGYRNPEEALYLESKLKNQIFPNRSTSVWYIESTPEESYQRFADREGSTRIDFEEFKLTLKSENEMGVEGFREIASLIINNDSDVDHLKDKVGEILREGDMYAKEKTNIRSNIEGLTKNSRCIEKD